MFTKKALQILLPTIACAIIGWVSLPHEKLLLSQSHKIINIPGWDSAYRRYTWCSRDEVLLEGNENFSGGAISMIAYNVDTGTQRDCLAWQKCLQQRQDKYNTFWVSPDGAWLLYSDYYKATIKAASGDGSQSLYWCSTLWDSKNKGPLTRYLGWYGICWLPDSRRWVQPVFDSNSGLAKYLVVRDVRSPSNLLHVAIPSACQPLFTAEDYDTVYISSSHLVQEQFSPRLDYNATGNVVDVYEADLTLTTPPIKHQIKLPTEWKIQQVQLSTQARWIAWVVHIQYKSPILLFLQQMHVLVDIASIEVTSVYISDPIGQNFREIGHVPTPSDPNQDVEVRWLPDDKQIVFVYKNEIYKIYINI